MTFLNKCRKACATIASIAVLAGGLAAGTATAYASGGGGNAGGGIPTGGGGFFLSWRYQDNNDGGFGSATDTNSVRKALEMDWTRIEGSADAWINEALNEANSNCVARFNEAHPGETANCRVVAVGAIGTSSRQFGYVAGASHSIWMDAWNQTVQGGPYYNNGKSYSTSDIFTDQPGMSVDIIADQYAPDFVNGASTGSLVVIALNQYEPADPSYDLSISTQASGTTTKAGDTGDVSDTISLSNGGANTVENVSGTATLHWRGVDGSTRTASKSFTASNTGSTQVSFGYRDVDSSWESWPAGSFWFDVDVPKQGNMAAAASHAGEQDAKESWSASNEPPTKTLTNAAGETVTDDNDSIVSGSLYTAHISAHSSASSQFWIYDTIETKDVVIGGIDADDLSKVTVTDASGNVVAADISIDDSQEGKRVVKAHVTNPHSGVYTLNIPQSAKPTGSDYTISDGSIACWTGDNGMGSLADCQTGNSDEVGKVTPQPDKVWVLDEEGALEAADPDHTNQEGVDTKTFLVGDKIAVVVNGTLPAHLLNPLASYSITDDLTGSTEWIDWQSGKVFVDGEDVTDQFDIVIDQGARTATATAKASYIAATMFKTSESEVKFYLEGVIKAGATAGKKIQLTNVASETWNNETIETNEPPVFVWTPNPDKAWVKLDSDGDWVTVTDPTKSDMVGADNDYFRLGDRVAAVINGTLPTGLGRVPEISFSDDYSAVDSILDLDADNIRVYEQDASTSETSSIDGINKTGTDVTDRFDITTDGTKVTVNAHDDYEAEQKDLAVAKQITVLVTFDVQFDTTELLESYGKEQGDELNTCVDPSGADLDNVGSQTVGGSTVDTNSPKICVTVPPIHKQVIAESSQGGDQSDIDEQVVFPGQTVEYTVRVDPQIPADQAYEVTVLKLSDTYSEYTTANKQTLEITDLNTGSVIPKKTGYTVSWDDDAHSFVVTFSKDWVAANWQAGSNPRLLLRFEAKVHDDAPTDKTIDNKAALTVNNGVTESNEVTNNPPVITPKKQDTQKDPTISIDGKTALLGDKVYYRVSIDATDLSNAAYKVWRLGMVDDWDEEYLSLDETGIEVLDESGVDHTADFNIQVQDGVVYAFAKLVDTYIDATGETVPGDPQPTDLKAYSELTDADYDPLADPAIDQSLLGHTYTVVLPMTVIKVTDGYVVSNTATQIANDTRVETNTVTNPLKEINPSKDVTVSVGGDSVNGHSVYKDRLFLYKLDSSILPTDRAYPVITDWGGTDQLDTANDEYTGQWAIYASRDLYRDGEVIAQAGERIAGSNFDSSKFGGALFTVETDDNGLVTVNATQAYLDLVSADNEHEAGWTLYIQCKRLNVVDKVENVWTETLNGQPRESNTVWTRTPDMTPSLSIEKWDTASGIETGDRDSTDQALKMDGDSTEITFTITNTSGVDPDTGDGAWFKASDLDLSDSTIVGDAQIDMDSLVYPDGWDDLVLKPGESVDVRGTLKGVSEGSNHTDRAIVTGTPLVECAADTSDPFGDEVDPGFTVTGERVEIDGRQLCADTQVTSNTDDWSGYRDKPLASTGVAIGGMIVAAVAIAGAGVSLILVRRQRAHSARHAG
ncbi:MULTISPECIES: LPXTG cell wall anchor domain-containing protein [Bifidobacterium]|uniref:Cell wall anchor protein n=2 Tax=Bifidobacterium TaxID=1678 RepID=A0A261FTH2_9BIFI|nr:MULTISPECIES: LPXTG cell wall anchor domain-containing protein [Bifidobacterium]OZG62490.1 cell wall anchor protein [Bifidobacterium lemurum]OZG69026.1 cell wall anchor protein [Bifidobacterium eulemuris]QOL31446.1 LPXTG cell wall anchor domain-containing protein [Bifidobacterium eulemuris]QOL33831.1 LPXTG cell wall anchor domain-containing protein [Bifidobacterium lemurum]